MRRDAHPWQSDALDLDGYLARIGYHGPLTPEAEVLRGLHRAHRAAIVFENLNILLGRAVSVELADVQAKLVDTRRGGYCHEHSVLFGAALDRLGFGVDRLLARIGDPLVEPRPRTHLLLRVETADDVWLADVGFGSGLLAPIPLRETPPVRQGAWRYRLRTGSDGAWRLAEDSGAGWTTLHTFTEEPVYPVDVDRANWTTSTHPRSPFVQRPVCVRKDDTAVHSLLGWTYTTVRPGRPDVVVELDDSGFAETLRREFGLPLTDDEITKLLSATR